MSSERIPVAALQLISALIDDLTSEIILKLEHRSEKFDALKVGCFLRNLYSVLVARLGQEKSFDLTFLMCFVRFYSVHSTF